MRATSGVYFRREDYASFWLRVLVDLVDTLVFALLCLVLAIPLVATPFTRLTLNLFALTCCVAAFLYFVVLKRSRFRTIGYRMGKVRIVGLDGRTPGYLSLILRLGFGLFGPLNWLVDLAWLSNDTNRQALRDKFANTYVVRVNAQTAGLGRIVFRYYDIGFYNCLFREVETESAGAAPASQQ